MKEYLDNSRKNIVKGKWVIRVGVIGVWILIFQLFFMRNTAVTEAKENRAVTSNKEIVAFKKLERKEQQLAKALNEIRTLKIEIGNLNKKNTNLNKEIQNLNSRRSKNQVSATKNEASETSALMENRPVPSEYIRIARVKRSNVKLTNIDGIILLTDIDKRDKIYLKFKLQNRYYVYVRGIYGYIDSSLIGSVGN